MALSCVMYSSFACCAGSEQNYHTRALKICNELGVHNQTAEK